MRPACHLLHGEMELCVRWLCSRNVSRVCRVTKVLLKCNKRTRVRFVLCFSFFCCPSPILFFFISGNVNIANLRLVTNNFSIVSFLCLVNKSREAWQHKKRAVFRTEFSQNFTLFYCPPASSKQLLSPPTLRNASHCFCPN